MDNSGAELDMLFSRLITDQPISPLEYIGRLRYETDIEITLVQLFTFMLDKNILFKEPTSNGKSYNYVPNPEYVDNKWFHIEMAKDDMGPFPVIYLTPEAQKGIYKLLTEA